MPPRSPTPSEGSEVNEGSSLLASTKSKPWLPAPSYTVFLLLCLASTLDKFDADVTGGLLRTFEISFGIDAESESALLLSSALPMALFAPFWGFLADSLSRKHLMAAGAFSWGFFTFLSASAQSFGALCVFRALTGVALASIMPLTMGIVADLVDAPRRGMAFGIVGLFGGAGQMLGLLSTTNLAGATTSLGQASGWRVIFLVLGALSLLLAGLIHQLMVEPARNYVPSTLTCAEAGRIARRVCAVPTFVLVTLQGIFGAIPWSAISSFATLWLQYTGLSNAAASAAIVSFRVGNGIGILLGGFLGDQAAQASPDHGRPRLALVSVLLSIFWMAIVLHAIPPEPASLTGYVICLFLGGIGSAWCMAGVNQPILSEVVAPNVRAYVMAAEYGLESASSAIFGGPFVGFLAQGMAQPGTRTRAAAKDRNGTHAHGPTSHPLDRSPLSPLQPPSATRRATCPSWRRPSSCGGKTSWRCARRSRGSRCCRGVSAFASTSPSASSTRATATGPARRTRPPAAAQRKRRRWRRRRSEVMLVDYMQPFFERMRYEWDPTHADPHNGERLSSKESQNSLGEPWHNSRRRRERILATRNNSAVTSVPSIKRVRRVKLTCRRASGQWSASNRRLPLQRGRVSPQAHPR